MPERRADRRQRGRHHGRIGRGEEHRQRDRRDHGQEELARRQVDRLFRDREAGHRRGFLHVSPARGVARGTVRCPGGVPKGACPKGRSAGASPGRDPGSAGQSRRKRCPMRPCRLPPPRLQLLRLQLPHRPQAPRQRSMPRRSPRLAGQLADLLRLRTLPIGMKLFEDLEEMARVPGPAPAAARQDLLDLPAGHAGAAGRLHPWHHDRERAGVFQLFQRDRAGCAGRNLHLRAQDGGRVVREPRRRRGAPGADAARRRRGGIMGWSFRRCAARGSTRRISASSTPTRRR